MSPEIREGREKVLTTRRAHGARWRLTAFHRLKEEAVQIESSTETQLIQDTSEQFTHACQISPNIETLFLGKNPHICPFFLYLRPFLS